MEKGCIQLYYGDGKGKTTAAMGQVVRCVGHGFKVLVYQFLKEPNSGEVRVIRDLPGVDYIPNEGKIPFLFNLTPELVITGHQYGMDLSELFRRADYITKFVKEKHPFDEGMPCRTGIEE